MSLKGDDLHNLGTNRPKTSPETDPSKSPNCGRPGRFPKLELESRHIDGSSVMRQSLKRCNRTLLHSEQIAQSQPHRRREPAQPNLPFDPMPNRIEPCLALPTPYYSGRSEGFHDHDRIQGMRALRTRSSERSWFASNVRTCHSRGYGGSDGLRAPHELRGRQMPDRVSVSRAISRSEGRQVTPKVPLTHRRHACSLVLCSTLRTPRRSEFPSTRSILKSGAA